MKKYTYPNKITLIKQHEKIQNVPVGTEFVLIEKDHIFKKEFYLAYYPFEGLGNSERSVLSKGYIVNCKYAINHPEYFKLQ